MVTKATRFQVATAASLIWMLLSFATLHNVYSSSSSSSNRITKMRRLDQRSSSAYGSLWSVPPKQQQKTQRQEAAVVDGIFQNGGRDARRLKGSKEKKKEKGGKGKGKGGGGGDGGDDGSVVEPQYDSEDYDYVNGSGTPPPTDTPGDDEDETDNIFDVPVIESETEFLVHCREELTSASVVEDGIVSQEEFAGFFEFVCDVMDGEKLPDFGCPTPNFDDLSLRVQLTFAYFLCGGTDDLITCLNDFKSTGEDFGFDATFPEKVEGDVLGVCCALFPFLVETNIDPLSGKLICLFFLF